MEGNLSQVPENVVHVSIEEEIRSSYLDYAMSVIIGRAIPDVRDGLKPVHRRILYSMYEMKNFHNQPYKKSARIVGEVIGKYHPHGDAPVYEALVRMAQDFSMRIPLIDGQGNFGSIDGDPPAAMRYTEVRLTKLAQELLRDIEKETVDWQPNYDGTLLEPTVLPTRFPNLLLNGANGIAVGMATNIPPHNLTELLEASIYLVKHPEATVEELMQYVKGPDFPTGGEIYGTEGIVLAYTTGKGIITIRAVYEIEEGTTHTNIVIKEIPYQVNKAKLLERIAELVKERVLEGVVALRDESDREGLRIVIELKKGVIPELILNKLFKMTPLQSSFGIINLAIVNGKPEILTLKQLLSNFIEHRKEVIIRRTKYELREAEREAFIVRGLLIAIQNIDEVIELIKKSSSPKEAKEGLISRFKLTELQAQAILDMRLQRLTLLERTKLEEELKVLEEKIKELREILGSDEVLKRVIISELEEIKEAYPCERKTKIITEKIEIAEEDLIAGEDMVVTVSHLGYIKRTPVTEYKTQRRGGRGKKGMTTIEEDFVTQLFVANNHSWVMFFSDKGKVYLKKVYEIPEMSRVGRGRAIINFVGIEQGEKIMTVLPIQQFVEGLYIVTVTRNGYIKKTELMAYSNIRHSGIIGVGIDEDDELVGAVLTGGKQELLLTTASGYAIRFSEEQVRPMGRTARGVKAIELREGDRVVSMGVVLNEEKDLVLTVCENGFGKCTRVIEYRRQNRCGMGIMTIKVSERNGRVVGSVIVEEDDDVIVATSKGKIIRMPVSSIPVIGRLTKGVRLIKVDEGETVTTVERVVKEETQ